ncbi:MAG: hypothetical protein GY861_21400 [bacterium]|nr:hypothetical protein [bacterium]
MLHGPLMREVSLYDKKKFLNFLRLNVAYCGLGSVGSVFSDHMVRQGFGASGTTLLVDCGVVRDHNRGPQIYNGREVGQKKATVMYKRFYESARVKAVAMHKRIDFSTVDRSLKGSDIIIDSFDNHESRKIVSDWCRQSSKLCLHLGMSPSGYVESFWDNRGYVVPGDITNPEDDICEYSLSRNYVAGVVFIGCRSLLDYYLRGKGLRNYSLDLGEPISIRCF